MLCNARKVMYVHGILYYVGMVVLGRGQHSHILVYILYPSTRIVIISYSIYDIWAQGGKAFGALFVLLDWDGSMHAAAPTQPLPSSVALPPAVYPPRS